MTTEDHCYSFGSKNTIVKIGNSYDNETSHGAVIALATACIVIDNHDLPLRLYITLRSQIDQVLIILYLITRYFFLIASIY